MKLIQILGLVAAMSVAAGAQSAGTGNQSAGPAAQPKNTTDKSKQQSTGSPGSGKKPAKAAGAQKPSAGTVQSGKIQITTTKAAPSKKGKPGATAAKGQTAGKSGAATPAGAGKSATPAVKGAPPSSMVTKTAPAAKGATGQAGKKSPAIAKKKAAPAGAQKKKGPPAAAAAAGKKKKETKPVEKKPVVAGKPGVTPEKKTPRVATGRKRDPFVSPIRASSGGPVGPSCSTGKRCLFIPELLVQGTVRDLNGKMVAVVTNRAHHTYFLRESDQVFNGSVQRITTDSVIFREYVTDNLGRETAREVVKRVGGGGSS